MHSHEEETRRAIKGVEGHVRQTNKSTAHHMYVGGSTESRRKLGEKKSGLGLSMIAFRL